MKTLQPIKEKREDYERLKKEILKAIKKALYAPLLEALGVKPSTIKNAQADLIDAIRTRQIIYADGQFKGKYSSILTRELRGLGAKWDPKQGSWKIPFSKIPMWLKTEIATADRIWEDKVSEADKQLSLFDPEKLADSIDFSGLFDATLGNLDRKFKRTTESIAVAPPMSKNQKAILRVEYEDNLKLAIKDWSQDHIKQLRKTVIKQARAGVRYEALVGKIQESYGVSVSKAEFLARQETNLVTAKFREMRYKDVGLNKYMWRCVAGSPNHPVRPMHKIHDGKIYSWDKPPIVNDKGERKHPSEDFNCRCIAVPIVEF